MKRLANLLFTFSVLPLSGITDYAWAEADYQQILKEIRKNVCANTNVQDQEKASTQGNICKECQKDLITELYGPLKAFKLNVPIESRKFSSTSQTKKSIPTKIETPEEKEKRELGAYKLELCKLQSDEDDLDYHKKQIVYHESKLKNLTEKIESIKSTISTNKVILAKLNAISDGKNTPENRAALIECLNQDKASTFDKLHELKMRKIEFEKSVYTHSKMHNPTLETSSQKYYEKQLNFIQKMIEKMEVKLKEQGTQIDDVIAWEKDNPPNQSILTAINFCKSTIADIANKKQIVIPQYEDTVSIYKKSIADTEARIQEIENTQYSDKSGTSILSKYNTLTKQKYSWIMNLNGYKDCNMTLAEFYTLACYTADGYNVLNRTLRNNSKSDSMNPFVETLNSALDKLKPYKGIVHRKSKLPQEILAMHEVGKIVTYSAYTSTSLKPTYSATEYENGFIILSKTGRYVGSHSNHPNEAEVLFKANTQFRVISREKMKNGIQFVLEEVE